MSHRARSKRHSIATALTAMALASAAFMAVPASAELRIASVLALPNPGDESTGRTSTGRIEGVRMADADCSAAAAEAAAQTGGQVLSVSSRDDGGRTVCVVTVLVPGEDGERPRKRTLTLPQ